MKSKRKDLILEDETSAAMVFSESAENLFETIFQIREISRWKCYIDSAGIRSLLEGQILIKSFESLGYRWLLCESMSGTIDETYLCAEKGCIVLVRILNYHQFTSKFSADSAEKLRSWLDESEGR